MQGFDLSAEMCPAWALRLLPDLQTLVLRNALVGDPKLAPAPAAAAADPLLPLPPPLAAAWPAAPHPHAGFAALPAAQNTFDVAAPTWAWGWPGWPLLAPEPHAAQDEEGGGGGGGDAAVLRTLCLESVVVQNAAHACEQLALLGPAWRLVRQQQQQQQQVEEEEGRRGGGGGRRRVAAGPAGGLVGLEARKVSWEALHACVAAALGPHLTSLM